ncbi:hypothetical protein MUS1_02945 [Marinomonas ushuaiensis DSM 15871]|uniref:Uncharacterized protein n=1 Tax=Marinomonas ushuaiensis DSM 15871 TaxID=1122207 RepID=X7EBV4_9GAMM|nr:hypothetical protein [Marinomonas ushuaiensis]ETX12701.1 hypothetical protein MUS1_02945 [Marinomonas ushuaiensis DSM 15871]
MIDLDGGNYSTAADTFDAYETYEIYINIGDGSSLTFNSSDQWSGAENLGDDDVIILVSDDDVDAFSAGTFSEISWDFTGDVSSAMLLESGEFSIDDGTSYDLWDGSWGANPNSGLSVVDVTSEELSTD